MTTNIGSLAVSLSLDAANFNGSIDKANRNLGAMGSELRAVRALGTDYGNSLDGLASKKDILTRSVGASSLKLEEERRKYDALVASGTANEAQLERQARRVNEAQAQFNRLTSELSETEQALRRQSSSWHQLSERLGPIGAQLTMVGDKMTAIGKSMSMKVTAPIVAMGTLAAKAAIDFESSFAGVRKTVDASEAEFKTLEVGIRNMAKEIPAAATEIAGVAEAAGQLGIKKEAILGFTRTMVDLGVATNMSSEEAATALARLANITGMNQKDFDRLGSSVVALGNNFATTEKEIVEMGLRLAGAGSQVGMSEADILGLSTALTSVGINAEMGGSAFSRVMVQMQLATSTGFTKVQKLSKETGLSLRDLQMMASHSGKAFGNMAEDMGMTKKELLAIVKAGVELEGFSKIAGMTGEQFKQAFEKDAVGAIGSFIDGLANAEESGETAINMLQEMGITSVLLRDSLLRAGGANELFGSAIKVSNDGWTENVALTKEAEERYKTTASQIQIMVNYFKELGITLGAIILPVINKMIAGLKPLIENFAEMSKATQTTILIIAGIAAAIGPVLVVAGVLISSIGSIVTAISTFAAAMTVVTTGVAALTPGVGMLASMIGSLSGVFTILSGPIGVAVVAIAAVGIGVTKLVNNLNKDALPQVERFGKGMEGISDSTKVALTGFFDLSDGASKSLSEMFLTSTKVTQEMSNSLVAQFSAMNKQIVDEMKANHDEQLKGMKSFFVNSSVLSDEEETKIMQKTKNSNDIELLMQQEKENAIKQIMQTATNEKRALTERERDTINSIQNEMQKTAVKVLSASEIEQKVIMERLKETASNLSAQQAAEVAKNSAEQRNKSVAEAEAQYTETVGQIIRMRDESGVITEEQATKMIAEATRSKDVTIKHAKNMHEEVVKQARAQANEHVDTVDWETGEILTKWEVFKNNSTKKFEEIKTANIKAWKNFTTEIKSDIENLKNFISTKWGEIGQTISAKTEEWKTAITNWWVGLPAALGGVKDTIVNWFVETGISIAVQLVVWKESIATWFESMPSVMIEKLVSWGQAISQWADEQNAENIRQFSEWGAAIVNWFTSIPSVITGNLAQWTSSFATWFTDTKTTIVKNFAEWTASIVEWFVSIPSKISENLAKWLTVFAVWFVDTRNAIIKWFADWTSTIVTWFSDTKENIITDLAEWFAAIATWFKEMPSNIGTWLAEWWTKISTWFSEIPAYLTAKFEDWWAAIKAWFTSVPDKPEIKNMGKNMIDKVAAGNQEKKSELLDKLGKIIVDVALGALAIAGIALVAAGREIIKRLISGIQDMKAGLETKTKELGDGIVTKMKAVDLIKVGKDIIRGLIGGIGSMAKDVWEKAKEIANGIGKTISDTMQVKSPSRVTMKLGGFIGQGLADGLGGSIGENEKAAKGLSNSIMDTIKNIFDINSPAGETIKLGGFIGDGLAIGVAGTKSANEKAIEGVSKVLSAAATKNAADIAKIGTEAEKKRTEVQADYAKKRAELGRKSAQSAQTALKTSTNKKGVIVTTGTQRVHNIRADASAKLTKLNEDEQKKLATINTKAWADMQKKEAEISKDRLESVKTYVADKKSLDEMSLVAESEVWRKSLVLFDAGTKERVEIQKAYQASLKAINDEVLKVNDEYMGKMTVINEKLKKEENDLTNMYLKSVDDRAKSLVTFAGTFDEFEVKLEKTGEDLMWNLKSQVLGFKRWQEEIDELSKKAIDDGLIDELKQMGPKALPQLIALNSLTDKQMSEYSSLYKEKSKLAREQAEKEMAPMKANTEKQIIELRAAANKELGLLQNDWTNKIKSITQATDTELMSLKTIGKNAGQGLLDGLASMENSLVKKARDIANAVSKAMASALQVKSPSRVTMKIGQFVGEGLEVGMENSISSIRRAARTMANAAVPDVGNVRGPGYSSQGGQSSPSGNSSTVVNQTVVIHSPKHVSPSETARLQKRATQELALGW
ncbi:phage tail tape measure protein [Sporosarcina psychrophila]|uniref:TP901 family phage tail tape measure protein n=1 Tax=Sporosarcina psychrophila TaxID=1476 RepID=A0ABV2KAR1_SPOPS